MGLLFGITQGQVSGWMRQLTAVAGQLIPEGALVTEPEPLPDKLTPALAALVAGVKKAGIQPDKFAGGHGSTGDYAPLAALEGK